MAIDQYSRRLMSLAVFPQKPDSRTVGTFLESVLRSVDARPKDLVCDQDKVFWGKSCKDWCRRNEVKPRSGAVGEHGSMAVVERALRTRKNECTRPILVPPRRGEFHRELMSLLDWYNEQRSPRTLVGRRPKEVYFRRYPAHRLPGLEPRTRWPRRSRCARPGPLVAGQPGDRFSLAVSYHDGYRPLPIVSLRPAA